MLSSVIDRTDPLPQPPIGDPREHMPLEQQKRFVAPGEFLRLTVKDLLEDPTVKIEFPSGFHETLKWESFEFYVDRGLSISDWHQKKDLIAYLCNFKRVIYFPNEKIRRIRMKTPDGEEKFI